MLSRGRLGACIDLETPWILADLIDEECGSRSSGPLDGKTFSSVPAELWVAMGKLPI
jgi:hypothetical protein